MIYISSNKNLLIELALSEALLTFVFCLLRAFQVSPLCANEAAQLPKREVRVLGFDDCSHLAAEQDVATHVDLPLCTLLLRKALYGFWR